MADVRSGNDIDRIQLQAARDAVAGRLEQLLVHGEHLLADARETLAQLDAALGDG